MALKEKILELASRFKKTIVEDRRHLHAHPELSFKEYNTVKFVRDKLESIPVDEIKEVTETGLTALIKGKNPDKAVFALRGDMDALPITEANEVPYKSTNEGVMHACGHDVHTSSLLGTARILHAIKDQFEGTVKLIFQPGEERLPGGASYMIKEGVLENPAPKGIIGQHVMPFLPAGTIGFKEGMYMASADEIFLTVKGKGGHAAMPENNVDPVLITSHLITSLQQIVSRNAPPKIPSVLSFGKVQADGATNVIPDQVYVEGTFRTFDETWRSTAHEKIEQMVKGIAESMGSTAELTIKKGYPYLVNNPALTKRMKSYAKDFLGEDKVTDIDIWMAAEDFAYYTHELDACFYRLGIRNTDKGITSSVHTPTFDIDEAALETGAGLMAWLAVSELGND